MIVWMVSCSVNMSPWQNGTTEVQLDLVPLRKQSLSVLGAVVRRNKIPKYGVQAQVKPRVKSLIKLSSKASSSATSTHLRSVKLEHEAIFKLLQFRRSEKVKSQT